MRLLINIVLIATLAYYAELYLPWWIMGVVAFAVSAWIRTSFLQAFACGFLGVGLLWFGLAWRMHAESKGILSNKIIALFGMTDPIQLFTVTGLVGGIVGGLTALSGFAFRNLYQNRRRHRGPYM